MRKLTLAEHLRTIGEVIPDDPDHPAYKAMSVIWDDLVGDIDLPTTAQQDEIRDRALINTLAKFQGTATRRQLQSRTANLAAFKRNKNGPAPAFHASIKRLIEASWIAESGKQYKLLRTP